VCWVRSDRSLSERGVIATFNIDQKSGRELRQYLATVATQCSEKTMSSSAAVDSASSVTETTHVDCGPPTVIILDDLHYVGNTALLADAFNSLLGLPLHHW